ncbi:MAG: ATP-binding protein [Verrucomicrobia bacterium]|nr:ATP-binding protein [Prolixibacteraceae bacterium]
MERTLIISSIPGNIVHVRNFVREIFLEARLNMNCFNRIFLGISEVVNNAILHGNQLNPQKNVFIKMNLSGNQFKVEVKDEGNGFCKELLQDPTCEKNIKCEHGRGLFIIRRLADELSFSEDGRKVLIQFTIPE